MEITKLYGFYIPAVLKESKSPNPRLADALFRRPILSGGYVGFYSNPDTNAPEISAKQQEAVVKGEADRKEIWKTLDQEKFRIRRLMSEKYKTDFDRPQ